MFVGSRALTDFMLSAFLDTEHGLSYGMATPGSSVWRTGHEAFGERFPGEMTQEVTWTCPALGGPRPTWPRAEQYAQQLIRETSVLNSEH